MPEHACAFRRHASPGASVMATVCCGIKSALRQVQTSNDTCVGVENQLRWVQDRALNVALSPMALGSNDLMIDHENAEDEAKKDQNNATQR